VGIELRKNQIFIKDPEELGIDTFSPSTFKNDTLVPQVSRMTSLVPQVSKMTSLVPQVSKMTILVLSHFFLFHAITSYLKFTW